MCGPALHNNHSSFTWFPDIYHLCNRRNNGELPKFPERETRFGCCPDVRTSNRTINKIRHSLRVLEGVAFKGYFSGDRVAARMVAISKWHLEARTTIIRYEKSVAGCLNVTIKKVTNATMSHYFGYVFFVMGDGHCVTS
jgi:hypothetical protein